MTSGNELTLTNVLYVPEIHKNLVFGSLLNNHGFCLVFESENMLCQRAKCMSEKEYMSDGMWKLNVMTVIKSYMNKVSNFDYILKSFNL